MKNLAKRCMIWAIKKFHRSPQFSKLFNRLLLSQLKCLLPTGEVRTYPAFEESARLTVFVLHWDLFRGDLEALAREKGVRVIFLDLVWQQIVHDGFYPYSVNITDYYNSPLSSDIGKKTEQLTTFLSPFFTLLKKKFDVKVVMAPNMRFIPDLDWGRAAQKAKIPSVVLFREGLVNFERGYKGTVIRQRKFGKFLGDHIIFVNEEIKKVFIESGFTSENQTTVAGAPRMDSLVRRAQKVREWQAEAEIKELKPAQIIVFYFWPGKFQKGFIDGDGLWRPPGVPHGLFREVFRAIFDFGKRYPESNILIKPKKDQPSIRYLMETFPDLSRLLKDQPNIVVNPNVDLQKEIERASVAIGLNTTAILEAGLFGKRIIVPFFKQYRNSEWSERFGFKGNLDAFDVPADGQELLQMLVDSKEAPWAPAEQVSQRLALFDKWVSRLDGGATRTCLEVFESLSTRSRNQG
jgi:hypothetical protein